MVVYLCVHHVGQQGEQVCEACHCLDRLTKGLLTDQCNINLCQPLSRVPAVTKSTFELLHACWHVSTWLPLGRFSLNLILLTFI